MYSVWSWRVETKEQVKNDLSILNNTFTHELSMYKNPLWQAKCKALKGECCTCVWMEEVRGEVKSGS